MTFLALSTYPVETSSVNIQRTEETLVPTRVVREAVVNSLMHRDYRVNSPIQIIRYSNVWNSATLVTP